MAGHDPERARLRWRCRRGMRELDLLFDAFIEHGLDTLDSSERQALDRLLECQDDRLYDWFYQGEQPDDPEFQRLVGRIRACFPG